IEDALIRYCRGVDRRDMDFARSAYHTDAYDDHGTFAGSVDELVRWMARRHEHIWQSMHCLGQIWIHLREHIAAVESYCTAVSTLGPGAVDSRRRYIPDPEDDDGWPLQVTTFVRYLDRFELRDPGWRIAYRRVALETMRWQPVPEMLPPGASWSVRATRTSSDSSFDLFDEVLGERRSWS